MNDPRVDLETTPAAALVGTLLGGKYRLGRLLGRGSFGEVYEAEHVDVGRRCAVKLLHRGPDATRSKQRFAREARVLARLEHENIVNLIDLGEDALVGEYIVLEFIRGSTLRSVLPSLELESPQRTLAVARQIALGLAHAHAMGVVHRDLKPENVMLTNHADGRVLVKILDFGIARLFDAERESMTASGATLGTASYMAPEQARGDRDVDNRVDIYALGVIVYEALTGVRPFHGESYNETLFHILTQRHVPLAELRPEVPRALCEVVERALMKDRDERFASAQAFAAALGQVELSLRSTEVDSETLDFETGERLVAFKRQPESPVLDRRIRRGELATYRNVAIGLLLVGAGFSLGFGFRAYDFVASNTPGNAGHDAKGEPSPPSSMTARPRLELSPSTSAGRLETPAVVPDGVPAVPSGSAVAHGKPDSPGPRPAPGPSATAVRLVPKDRGF